MFPNIGGLQKNIEGFSVVITKILESEERQVQLLEEILAELRKDEKQP